MNQEQNSIKQKKGEHLSFTERKTIKQLLRKGGNKSEIAQVLLRDKS